MRRSRGASTTEFTCAALRPARPELEQLWPRQAEEENRRTNPVDEVIDQVEKRWSAQ